MTILKKSSEQSELCSDEVEAPPRLELGVELLQSSALPLGYGAILTGYAFGKETMI